MITSGNEKSSWASRASGSSSNNSEHASIRVKARYQSVDVLPLRVYSRLLHHVEQHYMHICNAIEPVLTARAKEDFVTGLIKVLYKRHVAGDLLADLVMAEVAALGMHI